MGRYSDMHRRSIESRDEFWRERAPLIHWQTPFSEVLDYSRPPFAKWFVGGTTNLCYNAVDRHLAERADQPALKFLSTETGDARVFTYRNLYDEVNRFAAILKTLGVEKGDRVLIYMPMIPEAVFAMLACARVGAIHSVVFGGFAAASLATRIDDAAPKVMVTADAGMRAGKPIPYKHLVDEAIRLAKQPPAHVIIVDRRLVTTDANASSSAREANVPHSGGRDLDYAQLAAEHQGALDDCTWLESSDPSYILYTSGTTGKPKGVQRDTGGYAVALAWSMQSIFCVDPGDNFFCTSDIGWVVGHSYIVYGPLIGGMATIMYEGTPVKPDAGVLWRLVERYKATVMFSAPTAIRVLKKHDESFLKQHDTSSLRALYLAGEPLDEPTARWIGDALGCPVVDNYWQTETGWPILSTALGVEATPLRFGSPGKPMAGFDVRVLDDATGEELGAGEKGVVAILPPLPPGCLQTLWRDDERFVSTYFKSIPGQLAYSTFDWGIRDADGYWFILGRTDDVINVAGHRLGTREIEEAILAHPAVAECAVVGVADALKGQVAVGFAVLRDTALAESFAASPQAALKLEGEVMATVDRQLGAVARPSRVHFVGALPKTRSGKVLRRSMQAVCEGRDPGDLTTIEDPAALEQVRRAVSPPA